MNSEAVNRVVEILEKAKKELVVNFTPKKSNSGYKVRNRFNYVTLWVGTEYKDISYGYYEIKNSPLGPVMFLIDDSNMGILEDVVTVKIPAIKWVVNVRKGFLGFNKALNFICSVPNVETTLSTEEAKHLYDTYLDIPLPETAKNIKAPDVWADSGGFSPRLLEAVAKKDGEHKPFEPGDFVPTDEFGWFERDSSR